MKSFFYKQKLFLIVIPLFCSISYAVDPVAWWTLDEPNGIIAADFIGDANGILMNGPAWTDGIIDGGLSFDGTDDYVDIVGYKGVTGETSRTCSAWIKTTAVSDEIIAWGDDSPGGKWLIRVNEDGALRTEVQGGYIYGTTVVNDGNWHHIVVVLDSDGTPDISEVLLYVDGQLETISDVLDEPISTATGQNVAIGVFTLVQNRYFQGLIDDVRIYDVALNVTQIRAVMGNPFVSQAWVDDDYTSDGANDGHVWGYDAFDKIQDGIGSVGAGATVNVAAGTYVENITLRNGVKVIGAGADETIIDGNQNGSVVTSIGCDPNTLLERFTITNGSGTVYDGSSSGGGMYNGENSSPTVSTCTFINNTSTAIGGAMVISNSMVITDCSFINNSTFLYGGALFIDTAAPTISNCVFIENFADYLGGGAVYNQFSDSFFENCFFISNFDDCSLMTPPELSGGGALLNTRSNPQLINCTLVNNGKQLSNTYCMIGAALNNCNESHPVLTNCILWNNGCDDPVNEITNFDDSTVTVSYSDIRGGWDGTGNIDTDPLFVDPDNSDYHLQDDSPCIDTGDPAYQPVGETDIDGDPRVMDSYIDMGTDETFPTNCMKKAHPDYAKWVEYGKPGCWCYARAI